MKKPLQVKISTANHQWPLLRQTPGEQGIWGNTRFFVDKHVEECDFWIVYDKLLTTESTRCPKANTIFIAGEPPTVKKYSNNFLSQFGTIISSDRSIQHPNVEYSQQCLPWMVGARFDEEKKQWKPAFTKNYDELKRKTFVEKTKLLSLISSNKKITSGHRLRMEFIDKVAKYFGNDIDIFGNGFNALEDKWDALSPYEYTIVLENSSIPDYWSEKLSDSFLSLTYPFYFGAPNISDYFSLKSLTTINIENSEKSLRQLKRAIDSKTYTSSRKELNKSKSLVLDEYNLFSFASRFCNDTNHDTEKIVVTLKPEKQSLTSLLATKLHNYL